VNGEKPIFSAAGAAEEESPLAALELPASVGLALQAAREMAAAMPSAAASGRTAERVVVFIVTCTFA
jgi:hypothetical protein